MKYEIERRNPPNTEIIKADEYMVTEGRLSFKTNGKLVRTLDSGQWRGVKLLPENYGIRDKLFLNLHKRCGVQIKSSRQVRECLGENFFHHHTKLPHTLDTEAVLMAINDTFEGGE